MLVMVHVVRVFFPYRHHAAVRYLAGRMLELNGGVVDLEARLQRAAYLCQDPIALRWWDIRNRDVGGQGMRL